MRSLINNAELAAVNGGMTVYEFQDQYPSTAQRESALSHMSNYVSNEIIDNCGTIQGQIDYSKFLKD